MKCSAMCLALLLGCLGVACTKLPDRTVWVGIPRDTLPDTLSVPAAYGNLVAVTINPAFTDVEQLWFQDSLRRIHLVVYEVHSRVFNRHSPLITRH